MEQKHLNLRKFALFILFPIHVIFYFIDYKISEVFFLFCFMVLAADAALSFRDLRLLTSKRGRIGIFAHDFLLHLGKKALIAAADFIAFLIFEHTHHSFDNIDREVVWLYACLIIMVLSAFVIFVIGAARTMLFHDDAENR